MKKVVLGKNLGQKRPTDQDGDFLPLSSESKRVKAQGISAITASHLYRVPLIHRAKREEQKRQVHLQSEKRRRELIQEGILALQQEIPNINHRRVSKAIILHTAADVLEASISKDAILSNQLIALQNEYMQLRETQVVARRLQKHREHDQGSQQGVVETNSKDRRRYMQ